MAFLKTIGKAVISGVSKPTYTVIRTDQVTFQPLPPPNHSTTTQLPPPPTHIHPHAFTKKSEGTYLFGNLSTNTSVRYLMCATSPGSFETLQVFLLLSKDVHVLWMQSSIYIVSCFFLQIDIILKLLLLLFPIL